jgi:hypothetical protein
MWSLLSPFFSRMTLFKHAVGKMHCSCPQIYSKDHGFSIAYSRFWYAIIESSKIHNFSAYFLNTHGNGEVPVLGELPYTVLTYRCALLHWKSCLILCFP